jgi:hypothetical protein
MGWKAEVIADNSGKWVSNKLVFATQQEAETYAQDLSYRWTLVRQTRTVEVPEPASYCWTPQGVQPL